MVKHMDKYLGHKYTSSRYLSAIIKEMDIEDELSRATGYYTTRIFWDLHAVSALLRVLKSRRL
jgi:hypothetical protein